MGRGRNRRIAYPQADPRVLRPGSRSSGERRRDEPWPHGQQGPGAPPRNPVVRLREELIDVPPWFPGPRDQRDAAGRHYLTKAEINALYFATYQMGRPRGWDARSRSEDTGVPPGSLLQLRRRHRDRLAVHARPRADPLAAHHLGPAVAGPRGQGAVALGLAVLPPGEDRQGVLPADEPRRPRALKRHHAGRPATRRLSSSGRARPTPASRPSAGSPASSRG